MSQPDLSPAHKDWTGLETNSKISYLGKDALPQYIQTFTFSPKAEATAMKLLKTLAKSRGGKCSAAILGMSAAYFRIGDFDKLDEKFHGLEGNELPTIIKWKKTLLDSSQKVKKVLANADQLRIAHEWDLQDGNIKRFEDTPLPFNFSSWFSQGMKVDQPWEIDPELVLMNEDPDTLPNSAVQLTLTEADYIEWLSRTNHEFWTMIDLSVKTLSLTPLQQYALLCYNTQFTPEALNWRVINWEADQLKALIPELKNAYTTYGPGGLYGNLKRLSSNIPRGFMLAVAQYILQVKINEGKKRS